MAPYTGYMRKPHYYETDQMGIIHHSNYIRWFEEARVELLSFLKLPYEKIEEQGLIVPVLEVSAQYKEMIHYGDSLRIDITVEKYTGTRLDFSYQVFKENQQLATTGSSKHCFLAKDTGRLVQLKKTHPEIHKIFDTYQKNTAEK